MPADDQLAAFGPLVIAIRWGTAAIGLALAGLGNDAGRLLPYGVLLLAYAALRTVRPLRYLGDRVASLVMVLAEVALNLVVVVATDYWQSPYVFCLITAIMAAGFARGFGFAIRTALTALAAVALPYHLSVESSDFDTTAQWGGELLLIAIVAGYARRLFGEQERRNVLALQANDLLAQLNAVAQTLPASLDLDETVQSTVAQLRSLLTADAVVVMLADARGLTFTVAAAEGVRLPATLPIAELPASVRDVIVRRSVVRVPGLGDGAGRGLGADSQVGLYAPLEARGQLVGIVAAEARDPASLGERELGFVSGIADQAALAIDNARWFGRLRTVGADEERTRIARDLHDRVGQSLAYLAFELDRISRVATGGPVAKDLRRLREDVRRTVTEVRDTLYDLRTDVSETSDLVATLEEYLSRVAQRSDIEVRFHHDALTRLPLRQERELWRIAQEAVTNAYRHAEAQSIDVTWRCATDGAVLEVSDDGRGLPDGITNLGSYGIVGMRERATSIGAELEVESTNGEGTTIRCRLEGAARR